MSQFNDQNHFTDCVYFSVQMRSFLFLPFLQALDTASPPDLFKVHLVVFQTFSVLLHLTGLPLWPSWKARHRSRGTWFSSMERVGRRCWCNAQAGWSRKRLRRGVRSDAQLSCTETRFQKCSQSGKNGSKHKMLSISMAYKVISCKKKSKETFKKSKSLILQCKFSSRAQKWLKIAKKRIT